LNKKDDSRHKKKLIYIYIYIYKRERERERERERIYINGDFSCRGMERMVEI
jgi:hypothetical protein